MSGSGRIRCAGSLSCSGVLYQSRGQACSRGVLLPCQVPGAFLLGEQMQPAPTDPGILFSDALGVIDLRCLFPFVTGTLLEFSIDPAVGRVR